ncbi:MAG: methyltransferase domain-containing protein, partial [Aliifodinibius sp.]|nr:class I SAM-dependent methyltransferase [Fodinibius sp.]NIV13893.1 methyltransferase domain-containing protein [Fodinibius sp.]NIY27645.1 methyltransferase domain-containing protein [Fodinibius sp.]
MRELNRIRSEYNRRRNDPLLQAHYSLFNNAQLFLLQTRERLLLKLLKQHQLYDLTQAVILDLGCGDGNHLLHLTQYGAGPANLFGVDLLPDRLQEASRKMPHFGLAQVDGGYLPFPQGRFDLIFQFTVFSSILDTNLKQQVASEMLRVLRARGSIIWYDFWANNPRNPHVKGVSPAEIKSLFPNCIFDFHRVTLAPPLARRIV